MTDLNTISSAFTVKETMDRFEREAHAKGMTVFARVDHAAGAAMVALPLRPTELLIFGNAKAGTPLMQADQTVGLDLPLKALAWQDAEGKTWLTYRDPHVVVAQHGLNETMNPIANGMAAALAALSKAATENR